MTKEQIELTAAEYAAKKYVNEQYPCKEPDGSVSIDAVDEDIIDAFIAGYDIRQPEIDQLTADVERYKNDVAEGIERERTARKIIEDKRAEIEQKRVEAANLLIETARLTGWKRIPRDKDGFVEWDLLGLPRQGAYKRLPHRRRSRTPRSVGKPCRSD